MTALLADALVLALLQVGLIAVVWLFGMAGDGLGLLGLWLLLAMLWCSVAVGWFETHEGKR